MERGYLGVTVVQHVLVVIVYGLVDDFQAVVTVADWWTDRAPRPGSHERRRGGLRDCWRFRGVQVVGRLLVVIGRSGLETETSPG